MENLEKKHEKQLNDHLIDTLSSTIKEHFNQNSYAQT